jgi:hypothetical protein
MSWWSYNFAEALESKDSGSGNKQTKFQNNDTLELDYSAKHALDICCTDLPGKHDKQIYLKATASLLKVTHATSLRGL